MVAVRSGGDLAIVLAVVVAVNLSEPATGPWWKHFFGTIALGGPHS